MFDNSVFYRYLDLTPLRGRRTGKVRCIFHQEKTSSLSIDLDACVFHCFGCGEQGGVKRFSELVGETPVTPITTPTPGTTPAPEPPPETTFQAGLRIAAGQRWVALAEKYARADRMRRGLQWAAALRRHAATATEQEWDTQEWPWELIRYAARLEANINAADAA